MNRLAIPIFIGVLTIGFAVAGTRRRKKRALPGPTPSGPPRLPPPVPPPTDEQDEAQVENEWEPFSGLADVQQALNLLGFPTPADGAWSTETETAVRAFQQHVNALYGSNLPVDGEPDPDTLDVLAQALDLFVQGGYEPPKQVFKAEPVGPKQGTITPTKKQAAFTQNPVDRFLIWWGNTNAAQRAQLHELWPNTTIGQNIPADTAEKKAAVEEQLRLIVLQSSLLNDPEEDPQAAEMHAFLSNVLGEPLTEQFYMLMVDLLEATTDWPVDPDEVTWSDLLFVAPDCTSVVVGGFWAKHRLTARVVEAAKAIKDYNVLMPPEIVLDSLLNEDAPDCVEATYESWGEDMKGWYDYWVGVIGEELDAYAKHPELLEGG